MVGLVPNQTGPVSGSVSGGAYPSTPRHPDVQNDPILATPRIIRSGRFQKPFVPYRYGHSKMALRPL